MSAPPEPEAPVADPGAPALLAALSRLPPRSAQLLGHVAAAGAGARDVAALYGVSEEAVGVHALRALRLLERALSSSGELLPADEPPTDFARERDAARTLMARWDSTRESPRPRSGDADPKTLRLLSLLALLRARGPELQRLAESHERAEAESPRGRRREWLRRGALVALVLLAGWLYLRTR